MDLVDFAIFCLVYMGMILGRLPGLALDRTGAALLGAVALMAFKRISPHDAWEAVDVPTVGLLFGLMIVSAQFRLGGAYAALTRWIASAEVSPEVLLALLIAAAGALSAVLANDIVCLAVTPILIDGCARRNLNPVPFLLGLSCAANVGSAMTLIGNPQNMLIGQRLHLSFAGYLLDGGVPALVGLAATWAIIRQRFRGDWQRQTAVGDVHAPHFNPWQTAKGAVVLAALITAFMACPWPREVLALVAGSVLLMSRRMHSRRMLGLVDWQLLVLFIGLFVVNRSLEASGDLARMMRPLEAAGAGLARPAPLFIAAALLSNLVSNVPAVMLLLPSATHPMAGPILALSSTLAGNLFVVGSIANIIVIEQASHVGVRIGWRQHARVGVPVTMVTLGIAAGWLALRAVFGA